MSDTSFPVDNFREAAPHLRRPFTAAAVKFKVQATWPKTAPTGGLIVAYIDARLAVERLNLIVPHLWEDEYLPTNRGLMCALTIDGLTRRDIGDGEGKALVSDAFKRAAVKFGVGVSLYAIPKMTLDVADGHLKPRRDSLELTPAGEKRVRSTYAAWLAAHGTQAFGEPLDHGDSEEAQGDTEVEDTAPISDEQLASDAQRRTIFAKAKEAELSPAVLANIIKIAAGQEAALFETDAEAESWIDRALPRLPARLVNPIVENIKAEAVPA